jgi:hypothetical protein
MPIHPQAIVLIAEPYPEGDDMVNLQLGYLESSDPKDRGNGLEHRQFLMSREVAVLLHEMLTSLLSAPNAEAAWDQINKVSGDGCCVAAVEQHHEDLKQRHERN